MLACGGNTGEIAVWDTCENKDIEDHFKPFLTPGTYRAEDYDPNAQPVEEVAGEKDYESMSDEEKIKPAKLGKRGKGKLNHREKKM